MRVIALDSFTDDTVTPAEFHPYGHEFDVDPGAKLVAWLKGGVVRVDDRLAKTRASEAQKLTDEGEAAG